MSYKISLLGATGSIGESVLDIVLNHPASYEIFALSAHTQVDRLADLTAVHRPQVVVLPDERAAAQYRNSLMSGIRCPEILLGQEGLIQAAQDSQCNMVVCAIVGVAGLPSAYAAATSGKRVLLANKESLVAAGSLFMEAATRHKTQILPIDSEHNAIFQCLPSPMRPKEIRRIILTASGGPFRTTPLEQMQAITPEQACKHPNWSMGRKISVDSATMINKGLEVIEAKWLFDLHPDQIDVLVHPQSTVHSLVQFCDGSLLAQLGHADMRIPISYAMGYPDRLQNNSQDFNLSDLTRLDFHEPDYMRFRGLALAFDALRAGPSHCIALNAANEVAVEAFLDGQLAFLSIPILIEETLNRHHDKIPSTIEEVLTLDTISRTDARNILASETLT